MPISFSVRATRIAISPRFAIRTFSNITVPRRSFGGAVYGSRLGKVLVQPELPPLGVGVATHRRVGHFETEFELAFAVQAFESLARGFQRQLDRAAFGRAHGGLLHPFCGGDERARFGNRDAQRRRALLAVLFEFPEREE